MASIPFRPLPVAGASAATELAEGDVLAGLLLELATNGVVLLDTEGRIQEFNDQAHRQLGYTRAEFAGLTLADIDATERREDIRASVARVLDRGYGEFEVRHRTKTGAVRDVLVRTRPIRRGGSTVLVAVWHDVTDRKETAEALQEAERLLRTFSATIPDPMFLKDRHGTWISANPATLAVLGRPAEAVLGKTDDEILGDGELCAALTRTDRRVLETGVAEVVEETVPTRSGLRVFITTKVPYRDAAGDIIGVIGSARDITDRKQAEVALQRREHNLRTILQTALDGFYVVDMDGSLVEVNPAYCAMSGYTREELLRMRVSDVEAMESAAEIRARIEHIRAVGSQRFDSRHRTKDGRLVDVEASVTFVHDEGGRFICFVRDVTDRKQAEERARQAQKLESIGRLAGGVAHDFNNLLTVILSCADALRDEAQRGGPGGAQEIEDIRAAGARARDLTRQLLAFSRRQIIHATPLDLNEVVRGTEKLLRHVLGEDVELVVQLGANLGNVLADAGQIEQVVMNLAVNARDAMPHGGTLLIQTENLEAAAPPEHAGAFVRLVVRDSGVGMSAEIQEHLFEPFFTTKPPGKGTGLGLATVYGIVQQSHGHVRVDSGLGRGTRIEIWLPRWVGPPARPEPERPLASVGGTESILVVEDDRLVRDVTVRSLAGAGYRVRVAPSGREALLLPPLDLAEVKLLVTDVIMPGMNGRALADELRRRHPGLRVLFVSGYSRDVIAHHGVLDDGIEFLAKPFTPPVLLARVRRVLGGARA